MVKGKAPTIMSCFVLVHGAMHGGWCWRPVREILERRGHRVLAPSLTGLARVFPYGHEILFYMPEELALELLDAAGSADQLRN